MTLFIDLGDERQKAHWQGLAAGDIERAQNDEGPDLLELILVAGGFEPTLLELLVRLRGAMTRFWPDPAINVPLIAKKDISHNRRILFYVASILFPHDAELVAPATNRVDCIYQGLDLYDLFVLLCAAYLHDYGKGQFVLIIPELKHFNPTAATAPFAEALTPGDLEDEHHALLEDYHSHVIKAFLDHFLDAATSQLSLAQLRERLKELYDSRLHGPVDAIGSTTLVAFEGRNAEVAQQDLFDVLWQLAFRARPAQPDKRLLAQIQMISSAHKPFRLGPAGAATSAATDAFDDLGSHAANHGRLPLLAALLRVADNLDMTRERLDAAGALPGFFRTWLDAGAPATVPENFQRVFTKWMTFAVVRRVRIAHRRSPAPRGGSCVTLEVILQYEHFDGQREDFLTLRGLVEKDFHATNYLQALCVEEPSCRVGLRLLYELAPPALAGDPADFRLKIRGALRDKLSGLRNHLPYEPGRDFKTVPAGPSLAFSPLAPLGERFELPTHLGLLYLVGYLETFGRSRAADISARLALAFPSRLAAEPRLLEAGGLLKFDERDAHVDFFDERAKQRATDLLKEFRQHPSLLREKIRELEEFRHLLPFSLREPETVPTGIDGIDKVLTPLSHRLREPQGLRHTRNLLVVGGPGTGKTTLLLQILHWNQLNTRRSVLMLTFEEMVHQLRDNYFLHFGWDAGFIRSIQLGSTFEETLTRIHQVIEKEGPDLVGIDGLSRLREHKEKGHHEQVDILFKSLLIRGITCIATIEEPVREGPVEQYQADGVIHLRQDGASRQLEIEKLRSQDPIPGRHAFEILDLVHHDMENEHLHPQDRAKNPLTPGLNVYPNNLYYASVTAAAGGGASEVKYIPTGVENLDSLLPGKKIGEDGYHQGETILVVGSPGAGKTLFGLHFLKANLALPESIRTPALWLSFEGPKSLLDRSLGSFDESAGFRRLIDGGEFMFRFVPLALISPEKVLYYVTELVGRFKIRRLVVDSVSEIDEAFKDKVQFRQYMTTFIHALAPTGVTAMFLYRVPGFFHSSRESDSEIATLVDTIISIKTFDMKNQIRRGLFVLKSRGRELRSQLQTMDIHARHGIQVSNKGWEMEGLLSGETGSIHEPEVFLKHFYENPAESEINKQMVTQFRRRYRGKGRFTEVRKQAVYSEFWSFRGNYGAGHSNIRVASISRYMVEAFRERNTLHDLDDFFPAKLKETIARDVRWRRYETELGHCDNFPLYTDIGILLVRRDLANKLQAVLGDDGGPCPCGEGKAHPAPRSLLAPTTREISWQDLRHVARAVAAKPQPDAPFVFALPYLYNQTEFMAFFFEILWTKGGDVFHFPIFDGGPAGRRDSFYKDYIFLNKHPWGQLKRIIESILHQEADALYLREDVQRRIEPLIVALEHSPGAPGRPQGDCDLLQWLVDLIAGQVLNNPSFAIDHDDIFTISNRLGREALEFLYDLVHESEGAVPNPYVGDLRHQAVFSRRWYSQVQGVSAEVATRRREEKAGRKGVRGHAAHSQEAEAGGPSLPSQDAGGEAAEHGTEGAFLEVAENDLDILPPPSFSSGQLRRSCTCENVWCLCLVKEALSPEIGWIYIDSLTSREWVERRAAQRCGLPYRVEDMRAMRRHDPDVYRMLLDIVDTKQQKDQVYDAEGRLVARYDGEGEEKISGRIDKAVQDFFKGKYHGRDVRDVRDYFDRHPDLPEVDLRRRKFEQQVADNAALSADLDECKELRVSETPDFERLAHDDGSSVALRSGRPDHRPLFHRVESILHDEIVALFSPEGRRDWSTRLRDQFPGATTVDEVLSAARRPPQGVKDLLTRALDRMQDRLIFDLLTGFPAELEKRWPRGARPTPQ